MKWGIRKDRGRSGNGSKKKANKKDTNRTLSKARRQAARGKQLKTMSDKELSSRIARLEQEKKLKTLTKELESTPIQKVARSIGSGLGKTGKITLTAFAGAASAAALGYIGKTIEAKSIYEAFSKGGMSAEDIAIKLGANADYIKQTIKNEGKISFGDPIQRAQMFMNSASFVKAAYKKGK